MKTVVLLVILLQLFCSCNGQENKISATTYTQKLEYGLHGAVKEVTGYIHTIENGKIPTDTADYAGKTSMTFDHSGNMLAMHRLWKSDTTGNRKRSKTEFKLLFSGKGKDISFKEIYRFGDGDVEEGNYSYVWSDDYNYTIVSSGKSTYRSVITLDQNYRLIKSVFMKGDSIQVTEELDFMCNNNKIQEKRTKTTENRNGGMEMSYQLQVTQEYDRYGNPTVIYGYDDLEKERLREVYYKVYTYYE